MRLRMLATTWLALLLWTPTAHAIVGDAADATKWQRHVVMVLSRSGKQAGFCSGVVLTRTIVLTAAHCIASANDTRAYVPGQPLFALRRIAKHPDFHVDAPRTRSRSIDLALLETADPLPANFTAPVLADAALYELGTSFEIAGFGVAREGDAKSSGTLRVGNVRLRAPLSSVLLWLEDPQHETGACTGDSGGPVFTESGKLAAIVAFAEGEGTRHCGKLTQAVLIAPQRGWIEGVIQGWRYTPSPRMRGEGWGEGQTQR
jgi:Trypsin